MQRNTAETVTPGATPVAVNVVAAELALFAEIEVEPEMRAHEYVVGVAPTRLAVIAPVVIEVLAATPEMLVGVAVA